jgi:hypothetical protein
MIDLNYPRDAIILFKIFNSLSVDLSHKHDVGVFAALLLPQLALHLELPVVGIHLQYGGAVLLEVAAFPFRYCFFSHQTNDVLFVIWVREPDHIPPIEEEMVCVDDGLSLHLGVFKMLVVGLGRALLDDESLA